MNGVRTGGQPDRLTECSVTIIGQYNHVPHCPLLYDYQVEVACQLLCLGTSRDDRARLLEGMEVLRAAIVREPETQDDARELLAAQIMLEHPGKSCGYTGDTWVEIDRAEARRTAIRASPAQ